jgi:hypothetical protein
MATGWNLDQAAIFINRSSHQPNPHNQPLSTQHVLYQKFLLEGKGPLRRVFELQTKYGNDKSVLTI